MRGEDAPLPPGLEPVLWEPAAAWPAALAHPAGHRAGELAPPGTKRSFLLGEECGDRAQQGLVGQWEETRSKESSSPV